MTYLIDAPGILFNKMDQFVELEQRAVYNVSSYF